MVVTTLSNKKVTHRILLGTTLRKKREQRFALVRRFLRRLKRRGLGQPQPPEAPSIRASESEAKTIGQAVDRSIHRSIGRPFRKWSALVLPDHFCVKIIFSNFKHE